MPTTECDSGGGKPTAMRDVVTMLPSDTHVSVRLFLDTAVAEAYVMSLLCRDSMAATESCSAPIIHSQQFRCMMNLDFDV